MFCPATVWQISINFKAKLHIYRFCMADLTSDVTFFNSLPLGDFELWGQPKSVNLKIGVRIPTKTELLMA